MNVEPVVENYSAVPSTVFANQGAEFEKTNEEQLREMWAEATASISEDRPQYIMRLDKKTLIKSEDEFALCQEKQIPLRYGINERFALHLLKEEDAKERDRQKRRTANRKARASRKRNRR